MWWKIPKPFTKWDKIWRLTALWESESRIVWQHRLVYEKCVCDCWIVKWISRNHLRRWNIKSCGCLNREKVREKMIKMKTKHWMFWTRFYSIYYWINTRCNKKNDAGYKRYWWRWIKCMRKNFEDFYGDMYESYLSHVKEYWEENTTIDRINNDWNYCKENCRRATRKEQMNNRRCNKILFYEWKRYTQQELCDYVWLPKYILMSRLKKWWDLERAIKEPIKKSKRGM